MSPGRVALVFEGRSVTYGELYERVVRLARRFRKAGVAPSDRVAYLGPNHPGLVETMFAAHLLGGIFVPLNFRLTAPEIDFMLAHSGTKLLVFAPSCAGTAEGLNTAAALVPLHSIADALPFPAARAGDAAGVTRAVEKKADGLSLPAVDEMRREVEVSVGLDEPAFILYTSGTTGRPKGAVLTHGNVVWNCFNLLVGVDVGADEVGLVGAPLFHVAALDQCLLPTFLKGGTSVLMPSWDVDNALDLIASERVTWMFGVAAMFAGLAQSPRWRSADLSSVRSVMSGGASVPPALITAYQERGLTFCQGYGLTETAPGATFLEARESLAHVGSAGVPVFFADVRCARPDMSDADVGEPGEVLVRGPNVTPGYWDDQAATEAAFADGGWFRSGDVALVDESGHFHIVDRLKDMYVSGGENVYPAEVESVIFEHPDVAEVAVVGVPDEKWGEVGRAFVVAKPGRRVDVGELRAFLGGRLARYKLPVYVEVVEGLPRTGSNKVRKAPLRAMPLNTATPGDR